MSAAPSSGRAGKADQKASGLDGVVPRRTEGLAYRPATGYWRNTYVPGDPDMRLPGTRIAAWARAGSGLRLDPAREVRPVPQLFDPPRETALALDLRADTRAIAGPTPLRLQVGLQGAERQGAHRPAMRVALLLDLRRQPDLATAKRFAALATALSRARQPGHEFSLFVAGPGGGQVLDVAAFRHGPLKLALEELLAGGRTGPVVRLADVYSRARRHLGDGAEAALGARLVLLATDRPLATRIDALEDLAHRGALDGITTSVVALGRGRAPGDIDRLVAAGQGHRRILARAEGAERLIGRELHAASRTVARAACLRIRLAPGVKLIDVLGSEPLRTVGAARVRAAEAAVDLKLARDLGITAGRGADEDGIQIVIPNFQAGDAQWSRGEARWLGPYGHHSVSSPRSSNRTCGFPASGFPTGFTSKHTAVGQDGPDFVGSHRAPRTRPDRGNLVPRDDTLWRLTRK